MSETKIQDDEIEIIHADDRHQGEAVADGQHTAAASAPLSPDDAVAELKRQLDDATAAKVRAETAAAAAHGEVNKFKTEAENAQYTAISRAIETAQGLIEASEARILTARESGDFKAEMAAQREHGQAIARLSGLEAGKGQMDAMRASPAYQQQRQAPPPQQNAFENHISTMSEPTKQWLRAHPDAVSNPTMANRVASAHYAALAAGKTTDTPDYFSFVEQHAGYRQAPAQQQRIANPSAAPSGQARAPNGAKVRESLTMTPRMRQLAKEAGVSETEWAKSYLAGLKDGSQEPLN
jgi:hypothetical protein